MDVELKILIFDFVYDMDNHTTLPDPEEDGGDGEYEYILKKYIEPIITHQIKNMH